VWGIGFGLRVYLVVETVVNAGDSGEDSRLEPEGLGFGVWGLWFGIWCLGSVVWDLVFGVCGLWV
jgi:hypothetical protein